MGDTCTSAGDCGLLADVGVLPFSGFLEFSALIVPLRRAVMLTN